MTRLLPGGENRMMTILFPDLSGYMAASRQAPGDDAVELVNAVLDVYIRAVLDHGGFIARCIHDEVLALFGAPPAREDDPERAIRAAFQIRSEIRSIGLDVKMGINTGLVYFGRVGNERHSELAVVGPAADVAARLVGKGDKVALPGQILAGEATHQATKHLFEFGAPAVFNLKGIARPVTSFEVLAPRERPLHRDGTSEEREWSVIQGSLDRLDEGARRVVTFASVLGTSFERSSLQRLVDTTDRVLGELVASGHFEAEGKEGYRFTRPEIREVAYRSIPRSRRAEIHREIAAIIGDRPKSEAHLEKAAEAGRPFEFQGVRLR
jgi:class 3 adenylate cyclase